MGIKGDTLQYEFTVDTDITDWEIRAELVDRSGASVKIATTNSGGGDDQIEKTLIGAESTFLLKFPSGQTNSFGDKVTLEVEIDTGQTIGGVAEIYTIFQDQISLKDENIDWTTP